LELLTLRQAPTGTRLQVRLTTAVGSYASKPGSAVDAVLIAPVMLGGETLLPEGSTLQGTVKSARRVGLGFVHETATLDVQFHQVTLPDGESFPISVRVEDVDNSREWVDEQGRIHSVRSTGTLSYRFSGYIRAALAWEIHARIALWAIKTLIVQVPEPEIYYPPGVELTLALTRPILATPRTDPDQEALRLTEQEAADLEPVISEIPERAYTPVKNRPSDLVNVMFIGSREEIDTAFAAAGWTEARPTSLRTRVDGVRAVAEGHGFRAAPMSPLLVNDVTADMSWQKGLNDLSKRHHIRIWRQSETVDGQEVWVGAATRDVDFAYLRPGHRTVTHKIEQDIDQERDKVAHDLQFTSCANAVDWRERSNIPRGTSNATGDPISTDARLAIIRLNDCFSPRLSTETADAVPLRARGNGFERILRRQVLSARSDLLRSNIFWRTYEGTRWTVAALRRHHQPAPVEMQASNHPTGLQRSENVALTPFSQRRMGWLW
jgi:hypothetical protein